MSAAEVAEIEARIEDLRVGRIAELPIVISDKPSTTKCASA